MNIQSVLIELIINFIPIISIIYIIAGIILWKQRAEQKGYYFSFLMFATAIYSFGYFLELNCSSFDTLLFVRNFEYLGSVFVPCFGILFIAQLTKNTITRRAVVSLCLISIGLWLIFITNPLHHMIYKSIDLIMINGLGIVTTEKGPAFYTMMVYYAVFLIFSSIILSKAYKTSEVKNRKQSFRFLLGTLQIPWLAIAFILLGWDTYVDPAPLTIIIICILLGINEVTNDLFELEINKWKSAYNDIGEPAFMIDKDGEIVCANLIAKSIFSHSEKTLKDLVAYIDENESDDNPVAFQVNDAVSWYSVKKNNFNNKRKFINYLFINITERKKAEEALQDSENRLLEAQRMANIGSWELNLENKTIWGSREAFSIYGIPYTDETLPLDILQKSVALEYRPMMDARLTGLIERNEHYDVEYKIKKVDTGMECFVHSRAMLAANKKGNLTRVVGTIQDITERKRKEEDILYLSYHDQLTGLYNRRFYEEELKRLDTERNLPLTIAMGDVNGLKLINDSFGHDIGDELLKKVAEVIKGACRADDIIARLGGDEFVVIFPRTDAPESEKIIQRIKDLASIEKVSSLDISISFGFGTKHKKEESIQALIKNTEDQMYRHKLYQGSSMKSKTIDLVIGTLYEKNHREMLHSNRVSKLCETIAMAMKLDTDEVNQIKIAGLMHDIGKIGIDEKILNKPGRLSKEEFKEIKRHSEIGYRILSSVNEFSEIADYVLEHQERWDGTGYPRGIKGENISLQARIIAVADAYDAMITKRSYQPEMTEKEAAEEIRRCSGSQFDPYVAEIFIEQVLNNPEKK